MRSASIILALVFASSAHATAAAQTRHDLPVADGDRAGDVEIWTFEAGSDPQPFTEGDQSSGFLVVLPDDATCPGDSANDDYRVQTFVVPAEVDPGGLLYEAIRPHGDNLHALYGAVDTRSITQRPTEPNDGPGTEAPIPALPPLSFEVFPRGTLHDGSYRIGLACTFDAITERYWDTVIEIDDTDAPQFTWRATDVASNDSSLIRWPVVGLGAAAVLLAAAAVALNRSARRDAPRPSLEPAEEVVP